MFLRTGLAQHCKRSQALCRYLAQQADDGTNIYIDRSGLIQWKDSAASSPGAEQVQKEPETPLAKHLKALIQACRLPGTGSDAVPVASCVTA